MSDAARRFGIRDADEKIVDLVFAAAGVPRPRAADSAAETVDVAAASQPADTQENDS